MSMFKLLRSEWYKRHEKKIWIGLTVVICVSFGITYQLSALVGRNPGRGEVQIYGEALDPLHLADVEARWRRTVVEAEWWASLSQDLVKSGLLSWNEAFQMIGGHSGSRDREEMTKRIALDICMMVQAAPRNGVVVTDDDVREYVRTFMQRIERQRNKELGTTDTGAGFDKDLYKGYLATIRLTAGQFEKTVRELLYAQRLMSLVTEGVAVDESEVWKRFQEEQKTVDALAVSFDVKEYENRVKAPESGDAAAFFKEIVADDSRNEAYRIPSRLQFEYLLLDEEAVKSTLPDSAPEAIQKRYDESKDQLYLNTAATPVAASGTAAVPAPPRYRPIEEVRGDIVVALRNEAYALKVHDMFSEVESAMLTARSESEVSWEQLAQKLGFVYGVTPMVSRDRLAEVWERIAGKDPAELVRGMEPMFDQAKVEGTPGEAADLPYYVTPKEAKVGRGYARARLIRMERESRPTIMTEDVRVLAERDLRRKKARELAEADANALRDAIDRALSADVAAAKPETLPEAERAAKMRDLVTTAVRRAADQAHVSVVETGAIKPGDAISALKGVDPSESQKLAKTLHAMKVGELQTSEAGAFWCVLASLEAAPAKPADFLTKRDGLYGQIRSEKSRRAQETWLNTLRIESGVDKAMPKPSAVGAS